MQMPSLANYLLFHLTLTDVRLFTNYPYTNRSIVEIRFYLNDNCGIRSCCFIYKKSINRNLESKSLASTMWIIFSCRERRFVNITEHAQETS